ncbi:hypothetical protein [Nostoc sp.]
MTITYAGLSPAVFPRLDRSCSSSSLKRSQAKVFGLLKVSKNTT